MTTGHRRINSALAKPNKEAHGNIRDRILFLCTGNYYRSRLAEELFNHRARQFNMNWLAVSRALAIEQGRDDNIGPVSPYTLKALSELGVSVGYPIRPPVACTTSDLKSANLIIAMKE